MFKNSRKIDFKSLIIVFLLGVVGYLYLEIGTLSDNLNKTSEIVNRYIQKEQNALKRELGKIDTSISPTNITYEYNEDRSIIIDITDVGIKCENQSKYIEALKREYPIDTVVNNNCKKDYR